MKRSPEQFSPEVLKTGLRPEDQETQVEGRDVVRELQEDLATHLMLIAYARERIESVRLKLEQKKVGEELHGTIDAALQGLSQFEQKFLSIGSQAELFPEDPGEKSVKLEQFKKLRDEFRDWWNLAAGVKSILTRVTHEFEDVTDFGKSVAAGSEAEKRQFYSRGWNKELFEREREFSEAIGAPDAALFNSGMSAIETIVENENLKRGDTIVAAEHFYHHTGLIMAELEKRGVKVVRVPSGDAKAFERAITEYRPKLVLAEVVSNAPEMEVFPVREMFRFMADYNSAPRRRKKARLVLDNTFLTPELLNLLEEAEGMEGSEHLRLAVVESATKYYQHGLDNITAGLVYSNDADYMQELKHRRAMIGTHLQEQLANYIPPHDVAALEQKMLRHNSNAMLLAQALEGAPNVRVSHPSIGEHPDRARMEQLSPGAGGLFYVEWKGKGPAEDAVNRIAALAKEKGVDVKIGVSFGHPETWVETLRLPGTPKEAPQHIRISVGEENIAEFKKVMEVFKQVLQT